MKKVLQARTANAPVLDNHTMGCRVPCVLLKPVMSTLIKRRWDGILNVPIPHALKRINFASERADMYHWNVNLVFLPKIPHNHTINVATVLSSQSCDVY